RVRDRGAPPSLVAAANRPRPRHRRARSDRPAMQAERAADQSSRAPALPRARARRRRRSRELAPLASRRPRPTRHHEGSRAARGGAAPPRRPRDWATNRAPRQRSLRPTPCRHAPPSRAVKHPAHAAVAVRQTRAVERVTGIGGFFFQAEDPDALSRWYAEHL